MDASRTLQPLARTASPLGNENIDDVLLTDDSLGLTPPKPPVHALGGAARRSRMRSVSATAGRKTLVSRSLSSGRKRGLARPPSPHVDKRIRNVEAPVAPADTSTGARLTALEKQCTLDFAVKKEIVDAIRNLQAVTEHLQDKANTMTVELDNRKELDLQMRREMYAVREQLTEKINVVAEQTELNLNQRTAAVIEAKFGELEGAIRQATTRLAALEEREGLVERVVQHEHDAKANADQAISGAFQHMDQQVSQVGEMVRKFETTGAAASVAGRSAVTFTQAMAADMHHMHNKLTVVDAETQQSVATAMAPVIEQVNIIHAQAMAQQEQLTIMADAMHARSLPAQTLEVPALAVPCVPCGSAAAGNPWLSATTPCTCTGAPPGYGGHGIVVTGSLQAGQGQPSGQGAVATGGLSNPPGAGSSGDGDQLGATLRALTGGNGLCHCVHVTQLQSRVTALEQRRPGGVETHVPDPWHRGPAPEGPRRPAAAEPPHAEHGRIALPLALYGPLGAIGFKERSLFDDKMTTQEEYRFNGVKGGIAWKGKVERHFISRAPILRQILEWAEKEELETITPEKFQEAVGMALMHEQVQMVNAAIWGFLSGAISGVAEDIFKNADMLNGLDAWRRITRYIDHGRGIRRETLRREIKMLHTRPIKALENVEHGVAEFENLFAEYARAGGSAPTDQEQKDDLLHILPAELREALLWNTSDCRSFHEFRDMVITQAGKILMNRQKLPVHHVAEEPPRPSAPPPQDEDDGVDFANIHNVEDLISAFQKVGAVRRPRGVHPGVPARARKCPNCLEEHAGRCTKPSVPANERKCFGCGKAGHVSKNCPNKKPGIKAIKDGNINAVNSGRLNGFFMVDHEGFQTVPPGRKNANRPMPVQATLADFVSKNSWSALGEASNCKLKDKRTTATATTTPVHALEGHVHSGTPPRSERRQVDAALKEAESMAKQENISMISHDGPDDEGVVAAATESVKVRVAMDSAAVANVIHPDELPSDAEYVPNKSGRHFVGANNAHIEKFGSCATRLTSSHGDVGCDWQLADVSRPLHSVAEVTGPGAGPAKQDVLFNNEVCVVVPPGTVKEILKRVQPIMEYQREGNLYLADLVMSSFHRQGQEA